MMIRYVDMTRTQAVFVNLYPEKYPELPPILQRTVGKIKKQFPEVRSCKVFAQKMVFFCWEKY